jgi:CheY-like chemotaxis protein
MSDNDPDKTFKQRLSEVRHDLRTPVGHIIGYAEMLEEDLAEDMPAEFVRDLGLIKQAGERLVALIDDYLGAAKTSLDEIDLDETQFQLRMQLNHITGYCEMLREEVEDLDRSDLVEDLGRIDTAQTRLLELVEARLTLEAFTSMPVESARAASDSSDESPSVEALPQEELGDPSWLGAGGQLLVVDDDPANRELLTRRLRRSGYEVVTADSGREALELLPTHDIDLVLLDLMMPEMDGLETLNRIKLDPAHKALPVIMLSASDDMDRIVQCVLHGAEDYLLKPFNPVLLRARIGAALEKSRLRQQFARKLTVFISSPGDVIPERRIAKQVMHRLNEEFAGEALLLPILWEEEPLLASETFQAQIHPPSETDIYLGILWSRIGSPLPDTITRADGTRYDSGTAFEFEDALAGFRATGKPDMLVYRKSGAPVMSLAERAEVLERLEQMDRLQAYVDRHFRGEDGSYIAAFHTFDEAEQFESMLYTHLRKLVQSQLQGPIE